MRLTLLPNILLSETQGIEKERGKHVVLGRGGRGKL
jgi:hypothetical protein